MGLDKFTPEVLSQLTSKTEKKLKKSAKAKVAINDDEEIPTLVPITKSKQKSTTVAKKVPKKKIVSDETGTLSYTNKEASINLNQPKQNKKVVFDEAGNPHTKKDAPINIDQPKQNKRIVFDNSYLVNSSTEPDSSEKSFKNGKPQQINFDKAKEGTAWYNLKIKPDVPWYQQGKKLKAGPPINSTDERSKLEEEGRKLLEEDSFNFKKGKTSFYF